MTDADRPSLTRRSRPRGSSIELVAIASVGVVMAVSFLVFGNSTGRILGAALLIAIVLVLSIGYVFRGVRIKPRAAVTVQVLFGLGGFVAIGLAVFHIVSDEPPDRYTVLSVVELAAGVFLVSSSYRYFRWYLKSVWSHRRTGTEAPTNA